MARLDRHTAPQTGGSTISLDEAMVMLGEVTGLFVEMVDALPAKMTEDPEERRRLAWVCETERDRLLQRFQERVEALRWGEPTDDGAGTLEPDQGSRPKPSLPEKRGSTRPRQPLLRLKAHIRDWFRAPPEVRHEAAVLLLLYEFPAAARGAALGRRREADGADVHAYWSAVIREIERQGGGAL